MTQLVKKVLINHYQIMSLSKIQKMNMKMKKKLENQEETQKNNNNNGGEYLV